ncbi:MAG: undecaprenyl-diphosphate phosphatase [Syntrophobacterales bacterium]|nr:MAG: undecaprenyl-diphosphate phosphatase [Syntrophobacterales bacterium]
MGIIQGVTEFLPVSSSGHLVVLQGLFGVEEPRLFFNVMLHVATLIAIVIVFWEDIRGIPKGILATFGKNRGMNGFASALWSSIQGRLAILIIVGTIPAAIMGFVFEEAFSGLFASPLFAGFMLMVTGTVLWFTRGRPSDSKGMGEMGVIDALIVGLGQGFALIPGISRSGITISFGLFRGMEREWSGRFSFLLAVPAILGALIIEFKMPSELSSEELFAILAGMGVAVAVGYLSLRTLMHVVRRGNLAAFSYYCWGFGAFAVFLFMRGP